MNHIGLAHYFWRKHLKKGDIAIDATCGSGNDTLVLAEACLGQQAGYVFGIDIQKKAVESTAKLLDKSFEDPKRGRIKLILGSHAPLPDELPFANLIVYNLGYLPGSDRTIKTLAHTTIVSIESALARLCPEGMISIMLYPGHHEGLFETQTLLNWASALPNGLYSISHHHRPNNAKAPSLLLIQRRKTER